MVRRPVEATRWLRVLSTYRSRDFPVTEMVLVESHLGQGPGNRPRYEVVQSFALGHEEAAGMMVDILRHQTKL